MILSIILKIAKHIISDSSLLGCICVNFRVYRLFIIQETMNKNELINKIKSGQTKGLVNAYICENLHIVVTKNIDDGYIPISNRMHPM